MVVLSHPSRYSLTVREYGIKELANCAAGPIYPTGVKGQGLLSFIFSPNGDFNVVISWLIGYENRLNSVSYSVPRYCCMIACALTPHDSNFLDCGLSELY